MLRVNHDRDLELGTQKSALYNGIMIAYSSLLDANVIHTVNASWVSSLLLFSK